MHPILRNILGVIAGAIVGGIVNSTIVSFGTAPEGVDMNNFESIAENMHRYEFQHLIVPFLAHALGTLIGAFLAAKIAATRKLTMAMIVGVFYLMGGIAAVSMFGGPTWFIILDLAVAYLPMGYLGAKLAGGPAAADTSTVLDQD